MQLEIGDIVKVENVFSIYHYKIIRVTKTKAIGQAVGYDHTSNFKREYNDARRIFPWHPERYDQTTRVLIKKAK